MDFWETTSGLFSYSATLNSTVDTCGLSSTAVCTWQFVQCCCLRSACVDFSGRRLLDRFRNRLLLARQWIHAFVSPVEIPQVQFLDKVMMFSTLAPLRRRGLGEEVFCGGLVGEVLHACRPSSSRWLPGIPVQRLAVGGSRGAVFVHEVLP